MARGVEADPFDHDPEIAEARRRLLRRVGPGDDQGRQVARARREARSQRQAQMRVQHHAPRFAIEAGQAHRQSGIVGDCGLDADHDRLVSRAHDLHAQIGDLSGDPQPRIVRPPGSKAVRGLGKLQGHARPTGCHPQDMAAMVAPRLNGAGPDRDLNSGLRAAGRGPAPPPRGFGSSIAETTRATPASTTASAQGGALPKCEQGSSVT